jgi:hypothetical protein
MELEQAIRSRGRTFTAQPAAGTKAWRTMKETTHTTVMTEERKCCERILYACSECRRTEFAEGWKFCPHCGAEIIRFDREHVPGPGEEVHILVRVESVQQEPINEIFTENEKGEVTVSRADKPARRPRGVR